MKRGLAVAAVVAGFMAISCTPLTAAPVAIASPSPKASPSPDASPSPAPLTVAAAVVPNPPPTGPHGSQAKPSFHGDKNSLYQVDDTTQPAGPRFLIWNEAGTWAEPNGLTGVPYMLSTTGLTEGEFWATANSLVK